MNAVINIENYPDCCQMVSDSPFWVKDKKHETAVICDNADYDVEVREHLSHTIDIYKDYPQLSPIKNEMKYLRFICDAAFGGLATLPMTCFLKCGL